MQASIRFAMARWPWLAVLLLVCCTSCSGKDSLNPVTGKVLYNDQPLKGVLVSFHPKEGASLDTIVPTGHTGEDGTFTVTTGETPGAPAGEYVLTFICSEEVPRPEGKAVNMAMGPEYVDRFKGAYAVKSDSKFEVRIEPGVNQLEAFHLK
jgi:hypothetical protein